jgi:iron complex outermembrane receptor protein
MTMITAFKAELLGGTVLALMAVAPCSAVAQSAAPAEATAPQAADAQPAAAPQDAKPEASTGLEDILVTARRTTERLIDVPVAVTAVSANSLQRNNITQLNDLGRIVPTLELEKRGSGSGGSFKIRGIGSPSESGIEQSVVLNFDGIQIGRGRMIRIAIFDLDSVEVLKGPQALFFGKNSPAGVVSMRSVDPGKDFGGDIRTGYEFRSRQRFVEGGINIPISDDFRMRVAGRVDEQDGFVKNTAPLTRPSPIDGVPFSLITPRAYDRGSAVSNVLGRVTFIYDPDGPFDASLKVMLGRYEDNGDAQGVEVARCATGTTGVVTKGFTDPYSDCKLNWHETVGGLPAELTGVHYPEAGNGLGYGKIEAGMYALTLNYALDAVNLTSVTGYYGYDAHHFSISDNGGFAGTSGANFEKVSNFSQELRAVSDFDGPLNFTIGAFFEKNTRDYLNAGRTSTVGATPGGGLAYDPATGRANTYVALMNTDWKTYSAFGQLRYEILPKVELAGGVRWTHEKKNATLQNTFVNQSIPSVAAGLKPVGSIINGKFTDTNYSPEATLSWRPNSGLTFYAAYKTGYKSGGYSNPGVLSSFFNADNLRFGSEKAKGGEVGVKFQRGIISGDLTLYSYDFDDLQVSSRDTTLSIFYIRNAAAARTRGVEAQFRARPVPPLTLNGSLSYNDAHYLKYINAQCYAGQTVATGCNGFQDASGKDFPGTPKWTATFGSEYVLPLSDDFDLSLSGDAVYRSSYETGNLFQPYSPKYGNMVVLNASARLGTIDGTWSLSAIVTNITNQAFAYTLTNRSGGPAGELIGQAQPPRQFALQLGYRF